ncbi:ABC transporter permease [Bacteroidota bacterium]
MFTIINIVGLAIGLAASILLLQFIIHELSFDKFHVNFNNTYRVVSQASTNKTTTDKTPTTISSIGPSIKENFPAVEFACRISPNGRDEIKYKGRNIDQFSVYVSDADFFKVFTFKALKGDPFSALESPNTVVITKKVADKIFKSKNPIDEIIFLGPNWFKVKAVIEDIPANSHIKFDIITSFSSIANLQDYFDSTGANYYTYFVVKENTDIQKFKKEFEELCNKLTNEKFIGTGVNINSSIQALKDIHLHSDFSNDINTHGKYSTIVLFFIMAIGIMLIAAINFINLVTATAENRGKEVGMKKVIGVKRQQLIKQFMGESILLAIVALILAFFLVELTIQPFGKLVNRDLNLHYFVRLDFFSVVLLLSVIIGILSGLYPSLYLSSFNPIHTLKKINIYGNRNKNLKIILVLVQFTIASFLIANIFVVNRQVGFMKQNNPGFNTKNVIVIQNPSSHILWNYKSIKEKLLSYSDILTVTAASSFPGETRDLKNLSLAGEDVKDGIPCNENTVQVDYIETYQMEIIDGRSFRDNYYTVGHSFILNETAIKELGLEKENAVGRRINCMDNDGKIIGIVKDFHFRSLHEKIQPLVLSNYFRDFNDQTTNIAIRMDGDDLNSSIQKIKTIFYESDPNFNVDPLLINDLYNNMYAREENNNILIIIATILALFIAVLGLFSLTSYTVLKRTKEIGLRRVVGAPVHKIVFMLIKDIAKWVLLVNIFAWPISYIYIEKWLSNFAYRVKIEPLIFVISGLITLFIAVSTIIYQSVKAARCKPINALRYE